MLISLTIINSGTSAKMSTADRLAKFVKGKSEDSFLYFGYGSNLSSERIRIQNPSANFVTTALLTGWKLDFDSYSKVKNALFLPYLQKYDFF